MRTEISPLLRRCLEESSRTLAAEFDGVFAPETVERYLQDTVRRVGPRPTVGPSFLPVIIERFARERLWAVVQADHKVGRELPEVLFVCDHNAGRSQMAAALTHHLSNGWVGVRSAGSHPDERVDPVIIRVLDEVGVDVSLAYPKPLTDEVIRASDVVVTLGCGDACPIYPGPRYVDWTIPDPAGRSLADVRRIRYEIYHHVWDLLQALVPDADLFAIHRLHEESP